MVAFEPGSVAFDFAILKIKNARNWVTKKYEYGRVVAENGGKRVSTNCNGLQAQNYRMEVTLSVD